MIDNYGREMDYLRIAITDKCNLRCTYCMPTEHMTFLPKEELLSFEELSRLIHVFVELGVKKLRFTGGEPFIRKNFIDFLETIRLAHPSLKLHMTTNGLLVKPHIERLKKLNLSGINISLDTLRPERFKALTRRNQMTDVLSTIELLLKTNIPLKINTVVQHGINDDEITDLMNYFKPFPVHLRFIEFMPFNELNYEATLWTGVKILERVKKECGTIEPTIAEKNTTSSNYKLPNEHSDFQFGVIEGFTRSFCSSCNRMRLTSVGALKTCLYAEPSTDLKSLMRQGISDTDLKVHIESIVTHRFENGFEAQKHFQKNSYESMSKIGG